MKRFIGQTILSFALTIVSFITYGQDTTECKSNYFNDALLDKLVGNWKATGTVGGDSVTYNFSVKWTLNHQFLEMTFADTLRQHEYTAKVYVGFHCPNNEYVIHWIDNFGGSFSKTLGIGKRKDASIKMVFEYPSGQFINTFSHDSKNDSWNSHSTTKDKSGNWVIFGDIALKRN